MVVPGERVCTGDPHSASWDLEFAISSLLGSLGATRGCCRNWSPNHGTSASPATAFVLRLQDTGSTPRWLHKKSQLPQLREQESGGRRMKLAWKIETKRHMENRRQSTRESAVVFALAAAAVSHAIARSCASGDLPGCSCGPAPAEQPGPDFRWGGCGDNLRYGLQMGAAFVDAPMKNSRSGSQATKLMNLHNNAVGRQVLIDSMETKCKCHGVSGSCSVKTCWKGLQDMHDIAAELKSKYLAATKVIHRHVGTRKQLVPKEMDVRPVRETELVYLVSSPDYCARNEKQGSYGTQDRYGISLYRQAIL
ncbi:W11B2 protein, partial [Polypterus senegalus]